MRRLALAALFAITLPVQAAPAATELTCAQVAQLEHTAPELALEAMVDAVHRGLTDRQFVLPASRDAGELLRVKIERNCAADPQAQLALAVDRSLRETLGR